MRYHMILIIQDNDVNQNYKALDKVILFKSIFDLKTYKTGYYTILLINVEIDNEGIVIGHNFMFEELLTHLNVFAIITNRASNKLREICKYYNLALLELKY